MTETAPLDSAVGALVATFHNRTEYREALDNPHEREIHRTPDGRDWIAVFESVVNGEVSHTPSTMHWKLVEVIRPADFFSAAISCIEGSELDGIHLLWNSPYRGGHSLRGYDVWRRRSKYHLEIICFDLTLPEMDQLHTLFRVEHRPTIISVRAGEKPRHYDTIPGQPQPEPESTQPGQFRAERVGHSVHGKDVKTTPPAEPPFKPTLRDFLPLLRQPVMIADALHVLNTATLLTGCLVYEIVFDRPRLMITVTIGSPGGLAIGLRSGKTVSTEPLTPNGGNFEVAFGMRRVDRVLLYVFQKAASLRVCYGDEMFEAEQAGWYGADLIVKGIQLPFKSVNPQLSGFQDELQLANSRLLGTDSFKPQGFEELSDLMNATATTAGRGSPANFSTQIREKPQDPFLEIWPWQYGMGLTLSPVGRRVLGFSLLDPGTNLIEGDVYDYRILGYLRRQDIQETFYSLHTVPADTMLPNLFYLGPVRFETSSPVYVALFPPAPANTLRHIARKGLEITTRLTIRFPQPLSRIVLDLEPVPNHNLAYEGRTTTFNSIITFAIYNGAVPAQNRVELDFPTPIDELALEGLGFLYGVRTTPLSPGDDPEELVEIETTIYGVKYEPTPHPDPPAVLGTANLQEPLKQGKPEDMAKQLIQDLGFRLCWLPPGTIPLWPPDLPQKPKLDVSTFEIERRQVDLEPGYQPIYADEQDDLPSIIGGSRTSRAEPHPLVCGADLLELYPEKETPTPPVPVWIELDDILRSPGKPNGPDPGTYHQYRISSVDPIGRRSLTATEGPIIMLEKHRPPPQPRGPVEPFPPPDPPRACPRGVTARVIQASDPLLTPEDAQELNGHTNAIILEWGWTDLEREADPFAREFRVYFLSEPPDIVNGNLIGAAAWKGSTYEMSATVGRALEPDQVAGQYLLAGEYPFRIDSHTGGPAGTKIQIQFEPSRVHPTKVPQAASFVLMIAPNEVHFRPPKWDEREWYCPIEAKENYTHALYDRLAPSADTPLARAWVGVSAADDQWYVDDELPAGKANSGHKGNESTIVAVPVVARYFGRPDFQGKPLWDVQTVLLDEVEGETVSHTLDLPGLLTLPAGQKFLVERISAADIIAMLGRTGDGRTKFTTPDGKEQYFRYGDNPAEPGTMNDQAELFQAIGSGEPARVANKFLMDLLSRFATEDLSDATITAEEKVKRQEVWHAVPGTPALWRPLGDCLPNKPERYIYRARLVDAAGHVSSGAAFIPAVFRVPSRRTPAQPDIGKLARNEDQVEVRLKLSDGFDLAGALLFYHAATGTDGPTSVLETKPRLLRVPNRPDLYPQSGIRMRLSDGSWTKHVFLPKAGGAPDPQQPGALLLNTTIAVGFDAQVAVWAVAVTRDGIPSLPVGPRFTRTVPAPPQVPALSVDAVPYHDKLSWTTPDAGTSLTVEASSDGATWRRVSPFIEARSQLTGYDIVAPPAARRWYRLRVRKPGRKSDQIGPALELEP